MSLLRDIQSSIIENDQSIGPILLKLRLLAAKLGSGPEADPWRNGLNTSRKAIRKVWSFQIIVELTFHIMRYSLAHSEVELVTLQYQDTSSKNTLATSG